MNRITIIIVLLIVVVITAFFVIFPSSNSNNPAHNNIPFQYDSYRADNGFGYAICIKGDTLIKQENIPAIQKNIPFCSRQDAEKVAKAVIDKLTKGASPSISIKEINGLDISMDCQK